MNSPSTMTDLFDKLNDLNSVFKYGERLIPIIQSLVDFMRDTVPLLEKINRSLTESTSKIPKATNQINNVTSATEMATTEILDLVDLISNDTCNIESSLKRILKKEPEKKLLQEEILSLVQDSKVSDLLQNYFEISDVSVQLEPLIGLFTGIKTNAYNITLSLQVQDITSQQLAAVNHLIESVQEKMSSLMTNFQETNLGILEGPGFNDPKDSVFNSAARYTKSDERQNLADSIVKTRNTATQDEIDKLFILQK